MRTVFYLVAISMLVFSQFSARSALAQGPCLAANPDFSSSGYWMSDSGTNNPVFENGIVRLNINDYIYQSVPVTPLSTYDVDIVVTSIGFTDTVKVAVILGQNFDIFDVTAPGTYTTTLSTGTGSSAIYTIEFVSEEGDVDITSTCLSLSSTSEQTEECTWENINCTPTPSPTPTGTITPQPTSTYQPTPILIGSGLQAPNFSVPTSIPALEFEPIPAPSPVSIGITPMPTPDYADFVITPTATITLSQINTTLSLSYTTPSPVNLSAQGGLTLTGSISGSAGDYAGWLEGVVSYTNYLTGEIVALQGSQTITVINAPTWYSPDLPRPMASVGWTFEQLTDPNGSVGNFTISSWAGFFGYVISLPFQFIKSLWQLVSYFGPFGLFLGWLMMMFVIVLAVHAQVFIIRFLIVVIRVVVRIAELLGEWLPTGG